MADLAVMYSYYGNAQWSTIIRLFPPTVLGVAIGMQLLGTISKKSAQVHTRCDAPTTKVGMAEVKMTGARRRNSPWHPCAQSVPAPD
jgi:hypothetical protein